jgi:hypothetical protein
VNPQQPFTARLCLLPRSPLKPRGCGESIQNPFLQSVHTPTRNPLLGRIAPPLRRLLTSSNLLGPHESRVRRRTSRPELTAAGAMAAEKLRDLSRPIDVPLLDATVAAFYGTGSSVERHAADQILRELQNNPDMWLQVVHILQNSQNLNTKFFALQVLENVIKYKWNVLPVEQRDGIKNYISDVIVQLSGNEVSFRQEKLYVNKLNIILVQVDYLHP